MNGVRECVGDKVMVAVAVEVSVEVDVLVKVNGVELKVGERGESVIFGVVVCDAVPVAVG
jgi:hypothetical protein